MKPEWQQAIHNADIDKVNKLLSAGFDVNAEDKYGQTALMIAVLNNQVESVRVLVNAGCDLNIQGGKGAIGFYQKAALDLTDIHNNQEIIDILAKAQANN